MLRALRHHRRWIMKSLATHFNISDFYPNFYQKKVIITKVGILVCREFFQIFSMTPAENFENYCHKGITSQGSYKVFP